MQLPKILGALSAVSSACFSQVFVLPQGKDLDVYQTPWADTLYYRSLEFETYADHGIDSDEMALLLFGNRTPSGQAVVDTVANTLQLPRLGLVSRTKTLGRVSRVLETIGDWNGRYETTKSDRSYDSARLVREFRSRKTPVLTFTDSTLWLWNHPTCADDITTYRFDEPHRRTWSVDAQGHCLVGVESSLVGGTWVPLDLQTHLVWETNRIAAVLGISGTDTIGREEYGYDAAGNLARIATYTSYFGGWTLLENLDIQFRDGSFARSVQHRYDGEGRTLYTRVTSTDADDTQIPETGILSRQPRSMSISAHRQGSDLVFANPTHSPMTVDLVSLHGQYLGRLEVAGGSRSAWSVPKGVGVVAWKARGELGSCSGSFLLSRRIPSPQAAP